MLVHLQCRVGRTIVSTWLMLKIYIPNNKLLLKEEEWLSKTGWIYMTNINTSLTNVQNNAKWKWKYNLAMMHSGSFLIGNQIKLCTFIRLHGRCRGWYSRTDGIVIIYIAIHVYTLHKALRTNGLKLSPLRDPGRYVYFFKVTHYLPL